MKIYCSRSNNILKQLAGTDKWIKAKVNAPNVFSHPDGAKVYLYDGYLFLNIVSVYDNIVIFHSMMSNIVDGTGNARYPSLRRGILNAKFYTFIDNIELAEPKDIISLDEAEELYDIAHEKYVRRVNNFFEE